MTALSLGIRSLVARVVQELTRGCDFKSVVQRLAMRNVEDTVRNCHITFRPHTIINNEANLWDDDGRISIQVRLRSVSSFFRYWLLGKLSRQRLL